MAGSFQTQRTRSVMVASSVDPANRQRDYDAIKSGAGLVFLDNRLVVRVSGDDRISFLHGMCTVGLVVSAIDPRARRVAVRFARPAQPGHPLEVDVYHLPGSRVGFEAAAQGVAVLTNGLLEV